MKTNLFTLILAVCLHTAAQAQLPLHLSEYKKMSANYQKGMSKVKAKTSYSLSLKHQFTSVLIKMPIHSSLLGSYVVANGDTLRFKKSTKRDEPVSVSQLVVFKAPVKSLVFYSGALNEYVEFHLYNSETPKVVAAKQPEPSVESLPMSHAIAAAFIPNEVALDRHQDLHTQATISRHPNNYLPKRRKN